MFDRNIVENYVNLMFYLGGQKVEIAVIKDGRKGPHELLKEANKNLLEKPQPVIIEFKPEVSNE